MAGEKPQKAEPQQIWATDRATWRAWLERNHATESGVWLLYWKKSSGKQSIDWSEAVDEALCFGWIDSTRRTLDEQSFKQYFAPRKPRSTWSQINKSKVERLSEEGLMAPAGLAAVERAKANGSWNSLDDVEADIVPADLLAALDQIPAARIFRDAQPDETLGDPPLDQRSQAGDDPGRPH